MQKTIKNTFLYKISGALKDELLDLALAWVPIEIFRRLLIGMICGKGGMRVALARNVTLRKCKNLNFLGRAVINGKCILDGRGGKLTIGNDVDIGRETHIWTLQHDVHDVLHSTIGKDVCIGDHVWIATRVTILPGVTIGRGAVIAAGAIVTKDVGEFDVVAGNPAKPIGKRNPCIAYDLKFNFYF